MNRTISRRWTSQAWAGGVAVLCLAGCAVGPDYQRPSASAPAAFKENPAWRLAQPADTLPKGAWWQVFGDSQLNTLEEQLVKANQNIQVAEAQYRQARALVEEAHAGSWPMLSADVGVSRGKASPASHVSTTQMLGLNASWEPDLWGRVRREIEANETAAQASAGDLAAARLSAQATLAEDYFQLRILDHTAVLLQHTLDDYTKTLQLTRSQYQVGVAQKADVVTAETQVDSTQAQSIDQGVQRSALEHAIAVLTGQSPSSFSLAPADIAFQAPAFGVGVPADLLQRRPDVAAAERRVASANAQIGVAQAAYYPNLTLSASLGQQSNGLSNWLSAPNRVWSIGPSLVETLFDGDLRHAQKEAAIAAYDATVATYRQTVLSSMQDVEDNLSTLDVLRREKIAEDQALASAREALQLVTNQYKAGTVSYLNVLTAQNAALTAEQSSISILGRQMSASVLLIKAIGGGWTSAS